MAINTSLLAKSMIDAARGVGTGARAWMRAHPLVELQLKSLATVTSEIDTKLRMGEIGELRARQLYVAHQNGVRAVLLVDGADVTFTEKLLQAAAGVIAGRMGRAVAGTITGPVSRAVAGGLTAAFKAGKDL